MKRTNLILVVLTIMLVPALVFGAVDKFSAAKGTIGEDNTITVPLQITNKDNLAAMDIALGFSEGVTLQEVNFEGTRVDYFDLKVANIDNDAHTVVIGLLPQMTATAKPDLAAGEGTVANLVFKVDDPTVQDVTLESIETQEPYHSLTFVYHQGDQIVTEKPDFDNVSVSLSDVNGGPAVPDQFFLAQNYPNPFNPTTTFKFAIESAGQVDLSVYNVVGQKVSTVVSGVLDAGQHEITWNAEQYSSGVYFYRLTTPTNTETRKMMLLK